MKRRGVSLFWHNTLDIDVTINELRRRAFCTMPIDITAKPFMGGTTLIIQLNRFIKDSMKT
jgi:hypothetical protein